jgi:hypothetical protein
MDQGTIQEMVPKLDLIKELYQSEGFKPMEQFLCNAFDQTQMELVQIKRTKDFDKELAICLLTQLSILGVLKNFPSILKSIKDQFDKQAEVVKINRERAKDPLAEGE